FNPSIMTAAAQGGNVPAMQWIKDHCPPLAASSIWEFKAAVRAAESGHVPALSWLMEQEYFRPCPNRRRAYGIVLCAAARTGQAAVFVWVRDESSPWRGDDHPMGLAAAGGHLSTVLVLMELGCEATSNSVLNAIRGGHILVL
ncbi:hypothetical protein JKP88DRAFT_146163, partial [Tribonema minus]